MAEPAQISGESADRRPDGMPRGRPFQPGVSGNPKGRPRGLSRSTRRVLDDAAEKARQEALEAGRPDPGPADGSEILVRYWSGVMADSTAQQKDRLAASKLLASYGWGQPPEHAPIDDADPLDWGEEQLADAATEFDSTVVRLAERRAPSE